jgi:hypothetical protein
MIKRVVSHFVPQLLPNLFILFDFFFSFDFTQFNFFDDKILVSSYTTTTIPLPYNIYQFIFCLFFVC